MFQCILHDYLGKCNAIQLPSIQVNNVEKLNVDIVPKLDVCIYAVSHLLAHNYSESNFCIFFDVKCPSVISDSRLDWHIELNAPLLLWAPASTDLLS